MQQNREAAAIRYPLERAHKAAGVSALSLAASSKPHNDFEAGVEAMLKKTGLDDVAAKK